MTGTLGEALSRTLLLCRDRDILGPSEVSDEQLLAALRGTHVVLVSDEGNLACAAGQHALVALVDVVGRLGVSLALAVPEVPMLGFQLPLRGTLLRAGLLDLGMDLLPETRIAVCAPDAPADLAIVLGDTVYNGPAQMSVRLSGDAWSGSSVSAGDSAPRWQGDFPIGALVAAGLAAPEAFKAALRKLGRQLPAPIGEMYLAPAERATVRVAPPGTPTGPFALGRLDCVSGGAITNAALFTLLRVPGLTANIRVLEPERLDVSNQNRYLLARLANAVSGQFKIDQLSDWQHPGVQLYGEALRFDVVSRESVLPLAPLVLVGTDDIPSRWAVQREFPAWVGVGATSHFHTITSSHRPGQPCAGCLHPYDDPDDRPIPTISFVSYWAGLLLGVRLLRHAAGQTLDGPKQQIYCVPLRLDQPHAYWPRPVSTHRDCPVGCASGSKMAA